MGYPRISHIWLSFRGNAMNEMSNDLFMLVCWAVILVPFLLYKWFDYRSNYLSKPTFDEYRARHPDLVAHGQVKCDRCGGARIHVRGFRRASDDRRMHYCSHCGALLYRSER